MKQRQESIQKFDTNCMVGHHVPTANLIVAVVAEKEQIYYWSGTKWVLVQNSDLIIQSPPEP